MVKFESLTEVDIALEVFELFNSDNIENTIGHDEYDNLLGDFDDSFELYYTIYKHMGLDVEDPDNYCRYNRVLNLKIKAYRLYQQESFLSLYE